ncbi:hypothetical protein [Arcicella rosea]|uniref:Uncharacterized protein n=1 Tax=Arcicella rosea TaxID=502909 RepID=A0A841EL57_9BACT|nr:hypothetical protein [Arcicella rosea]MBB6001763.1 hypothetical protein [Arcicella rosea]
MKNQENIDKFFAERLQQYERQPRAATWEKLQTRLEKQESKVIPLWWKFASAASVALLFASGVYWLNTPENTVDNKFASVENNKPILKTEKDIVDVIKPSEEKQNLANIENRENIPLKTVSGKQNLKVLVSKKSKLEKSLNNEKEEVFLSKSITPQPISKPVLETNTIVLVVENTQKPAVKPEKETIVLNLVETQAEAVAENTVLDESANRKQSKFNKIWQQLKRAKNGENVDWKEVGFKPQKLLARADAKIENALTNGEETEK